ncbi:MAG: hypothetical protein ACN4GM_15085 [Gammaproteobacteria bacterium]
MNNSSAPQNLAILSIGSLSLAIPQTDIVSVDVVADVKPNDTDNTLVAASLHRQDGQWPVYAFSDTLKPMPNLAESCRFCVCIKRDDIFYALACDSVGVSLLDSDTPTEEIPEMMKSETTPVVKLMHYQQDIALIVDAFSMNHYLETLGARDV